MSGHRQRNRNLITAVFLVLFLFSFAVVGTLHFKELYYLFAKKVSLAEVTGFSYEFIFRQYDVLIEYQSLFYTGSLVFPDLPMSEAGRIHFEEVKAVFRVIKVALILSCLVLPYLLRKARKEKDYGCFYLAGLLSLAIPAVLGGFISLNWETAFRVFHEIVFRNDLWIFDERTDPIILFLPDKFFMMEAVIILAVIILGSVFYFLLYRLLSRRSRIDCPARETSREMEGRQKVMLFGELYNVNLLPSYFEEKDVEIIEGEVAVRLRRRGDRRELEKKLRVWYRGEFEAYLRRRIPELMEELNCEKIPNARWSVRSMKARWGSCMVHRDHILFNLYLVKAEKSHIDYVIVHELAHFLFPNHGREFKSFLTAKMPDWRKRQEELNTGRIRMDIWQG